MDYFAVTSYGAYPTAGVSDEQRAAYAISYGLLNSVPEGSDVALFSDGVLLIRQPWSEDYLIDGTTYLTRLPWSENYLADSGEEFIRQALSENYLQDTDVYNRRSNSEDYESDDFIFRRQPDSENYLVEAK